MIAQPACHAARHGFGRVAHFVICDQAGEWPERVVPLSNDLPIHGYKFLVLYNFHNDLSIDRRKGAALAIAQGTPAPPPVG
jgi:hypothetical protein